MNKHIYIYIHKKEKYLPLLLQIINMTTART